MRLGTSVRSAYADAQEGARHMIERAAAAREAGLDSLFVGDHHSEPNYLHNAPILGRLLAEWGEQTAGALFLLPLWHPVLVAEQLATLVAIARGPLVMQCAIGGGEAQFAAMGASLSTRGAVFEEALDIIRRLLAGAAVTSPRFGVVEAHIGRVPREVPVWIGGHAEAVLDRAARLGDGWIAGPGVGLDEAGRLVRRYRERCEAHGRPPGAVVVRRDVHVGATSQQAAAVVEPAISAGYRGFDPAVLVYGSPAEVIERLAGFDDLGFTDVLIRHISDDRSEVLASYSRLVEVRAGLA